MYSMKQKDINKINSSLNSKVVGISECLFSSNPNDVLITYALGSCIGVAVYDPILKFGGLAHFMLPNSRSDLEKSVEKPFMYVDTGLNLMINKMLDNGSSKSDLIIKVAGGAAMRETNSDRFKIGSKNFTILRKFLWKNGMLIKSHDIGGKKTRTVYLYINDGKYIVKSNSEFLEL